jgi:protein TonB
MLPPTRPLLPAHIGHAFVAALGERSTQLFAAVLLAHGCLLAALPSTHRPTDARADIVVSLLQAPASTARHDAAATPQRRTQEASITRAQPVSTALQQRDTRMDSHSPTAPVAEPSANGATQPRNAPMAVVGSSGTERTSDSVGERAGNAPTPVVAATTPMRPASDVTPPRFDAAYLDNPPPAYPAPARRLGEQGRVVLRVHVSAEGLPRDIETAASSGSVRLDSAARAAVERWRFVPARQGGQSVAAWVLVPLNFSLGNS